jgi:hypothetical protein
MVAQAHVAYYDRGGAARIPRGKFVRLQHGDDRFDARHRGNRLLAKQRLRSDYANDYARRATADLCLQPELAYTRDNPLDLLLGSVWLGNDDHIPGSGIIRMPIPGIFCKPRYCLPKDL